jgi:hypothetical protein
LRAARSHALGATERLLFRPLLLLGLALGVIGAASTTGCSIVEEADGGGFFMPIPGEDATGSGTGMDVPPPPEDGGPVTFRFSTLEVSSPGSDEGTSFAQVANLLFQLALLKSVPMVIPPVNLMVRVTGNDSDATLELCQAHGIVNDEPVDDIAQELDAYECNGLPYQVATTPVTIEDGRLTAGPFDFDFEIPTGDIFVFIRFAEMVLDGTYDPATGFDGTISFKLPVSDLCAAPFTTSQFCPDPEQPDGGRWSNLLDLMDGPDNECGQDGSADYYHPTELGTQPDPATCSTGSSPDHYPPDTTIGDEPAYTVTGNAVFGPAILLEGQGPVPLRAAFGDQGLCTESADEPCDRFRINRTWLQQ